MGPIQLGVLLGFLNVVAVAIGIAVVDRDADVVLLVVMIGMLPGIVTGGLLGLLASALEGSPKIVRFMSLYLPAIAVIWLLASTFGAERYILVSSIPTLVAVLVLERGTRRVVTPPLPVARVHEET